MYIIKELVRKSIHIGIVSINYFVYLNFGLRVSLYLILFGLVILYTIKGSKFISFIKDVNRPSIGHVLIFIGCFMMNILAFYNRDATAFLYSSLVIGVGDVLTVFGGYPRKNILLYKNKSLIGVIIFMIFNIISLFLLNAGIYDILLLSVFVGLVEVLSTDGWDNLTLPTLSIIIYSLVK